jgi:hypothetical protein
MRTVPLIRALYRREAGSMPWLQLLAVAGLSAGIGALAGTLAPVPGANVRVSVLAEAVVNFDVYGGLLLCLLALLRLMIRPCEDNDTGWLHPLVARGVQRWVYPAALFCAVLMVMTAAAGVLGFGFGAGKWLVSGSSDTLARWPVNLVRFPLLLAPFGLAGLLVGLVARRTATAISVSVAAVVVPAFAVLAYVASTESFPDWLLTAAYFHMPRGARTASEFFTRNVPYTLVVSAVILLVSDRFVAREG